MKLNFLEFDSSEDAQGHGSFDAMASAAPAQLAALREEVQRVLGWAHRQFPGRRGALDEGGDWDYELQGVQEVATTLAADYDPDAGHLRLEPSATGAPRITLSLTLTGTPQFCDALRAEFGL
ncbi:hypothetical protein ACFPOE_22210 [Caenimonas terrae]|uniref:Uncharacterized protein n=1 Tax=Caenimonas terrae TaxID=696074 RepID=A0ABW0NM75_9BURK